MEEEIEEEKETLERRKLHLYSLVKSSWKRVKMMNAQLQLSVNEYSKYRDEYEKVDRQLAAIDGRLKKITANPKKNPSNPFANLSSDQILRIAEELERRTVNAKGD